MNHQQVRKILLNEGNNSDAVEAYLGDWAEWEEFGDLILYGENKVTSAENINQFLPVNFNKEMLK